MLGCVGRALCKIRLHKWSKNWYGWRVCLRPGCTAYNPHFGVTGALRWMREHYTDKEMEEMAKHDMDFPLLNKLKLFMSIFAVGGLVAIGVWKLIERYYGNIENPAGAVIRLGMMAVFSILIWKILLKIKKGKH